MAQHPNSAKERLWLERIRRWQPSQLSVREYCRRRGFSEPSFYAWRRVLLHRGLLANGPAPQAEPAPPNPAFVKITVKADDPAPAIEVVLASRRIVRVPAGFDAGMLRQLLRLLEEPAC
jgi:hypothetical protein